MEKHPFFMKKTPEPGAELHPLYEGLQQLKYDPDENTPEELANAYKEDGNFNFKYKNYRLAIIAYTEGLKVKCRDNEINANLHNNRAAANYFLKNYRSSLRDCELALKHKPDYSKVLLRAANCCLELENYEKALSYCDRILEKDVKNEMILEIRRKCLAKKKEKDRNVRKKQQEEKKKRQAEQKLCQEIAIRNVKVENGFLSIGKLEPKFPELVNHRVRIGTDGRLVWPVVFLYPEYKTMDFIQSFHEDSVFVEHLEEVFSARPEWDKEGKYKIGSLCVYFEDGNKCKVHRVDVNKTLGEILQTKEYLLRGGTPTFIIFAENSHAQKSFLEKY